MHILVTGFAPFDNQNINPSWEAVSLLENIIGTHTIDQLKLPTSFKTDDTDLKFVSHHVSLLSTVLSTH